MIIKCNGHITLDLPEYEINLFKWSGCQEPFIFCPIFPGWLEFLRENPKMSPSKSPSFPFRLT